MIKVEFQRVGFAFASCSLLAVLGCGSVDTGEVVRTVPAGGVLSYNGQPLEYHQVTLFPGDQQRPAAGTSDADGRFALGTNRPGDGAIEGRHRVAVVYVGPVDTSPDAGINEFSAPPPPKVKIPEKYRDPEQSGLTIDIPAGGLADWKLDLQ